MLWFPASLTSLPCTVKKPGRGGGGVGWGHFSSTGINSTSCHSNWPSNPLPLAKHLVWFGHFVQIKPKRLKGDLLGLLGRKSPCSLARAPRCVLSIFFWKKGSALRTQEVLQPLCHKEGVLPSCLERGRLERRGLGPWWCQGASESHQPWSLLYLWTFWFCVSGNLLLSFGLGFPRSHPRTRIQGKWLIWKVIPGNTSRRVWKWHRGGKYFFVFKIAFHLFIYWPYQWGTQDLNSLTRNQTHHAFCYWNMES